MRQMLSQSDRIVSYSVSLPAPVGGWDTVSPITAVPDQMALVMDNFFPEASAVTLREGYQFAATLPDEVKTLLTYSPVSGNEVLFAAAVDGLYKVDLATQTSSLSSGYSSGQSVWNSVNITTAGGSFLWACNGTDDARYFNGTTWTVLNANSTPALTGIVSSEISNVSLFKSRLFLTKKNSLSFYYLPVNSIAGAAVEYPLGAVFRLGGYIVATASWTLDAGSGPDDYFVIVTSKGELAVYQGTDPSNAAAWSLVGVYTLAPPVSNSPFLKYGGDLLLLTLEGLTPLSKFSLSTSIDRTALITYHVETAFAEAVKLFRDTDGWQAILYSDKSMLLLNVPTFNGYFDQYVMNTMTKAWCRFTGMNGKAWSVLNRKLYFTRAGKLYQALTGYSDDGSLIEGRVRTGYSSLGRRGVIKRLNLLRPNITSDMPVNFRFAADADYSLGLSQGSPVSYSGQFTYWDQAIWDKAIWAGEFTLAHWRTVAHKPGRVFSFRLNLGLKNATFSWNATDVIAETGGLL